MNSLQTPEPSSVDDVRRVRERIAAEHRGDFRGHREETNRIFEQVRARLRLKVVPLEKDFSKRSGA
jgi:hypothetical protein